MKKSKIVHSLKEYVDSIARTKEVWGWLIGFSDQKKWRQWMTWRYVTLLITMATDLAEPVLIGMLIGDITAHKSDRLGYLLLIIVGLELFGRVMRWQSTRAHEWLWGINNIAILRGMTHSFFSKSQGQHREEKDLNHESLDRSRYSGMEVLTSKSAEVFETICLLLIALTYLIILSPLAGIAMVTIVVIHLLWSTYNNLQADLQCEEIENDFRAFDRYVAARWQNVERVVTSAKKKEELDEMENRLRSLCERDRTFWLWENNSSSLRESLTSLWIVGTFALVIYFQVVATGNTNGLQMLFPIWVWGSIIRGNLWRLGYLEREVRKHMPRLRATMNVLEQPSRVTDVAGATPLVPNGGVTLAFETVTHSYPLGEPVLRDVSFTIGAGETVALVGPSGSGKSTVEALAMRFMDPDGGIITVNGKDLRDISIDSWMKAVGFIPQHSQILDGTVRDNLLYGLHEEELHGKEWEEELKNLLSTLCIDFGKRTAGENPLDIVVGRDGIKLSGGQAQRLMIGAAVLKKPRFMIIDEATSSLDSTTEKAVLEGLETLLQGVGTLVIAHRLSTVRRANKIVVLRDGAIEAVAHSFRELHNQSPTFRRMADDQDLEIE
ncbi:MAG: ABC transporter ATP-binding protein/permease [Candidatus Taylorbacteria bacterium]|nr:ABC transporter ATP-binding protein/permease [Candidatus Taylorbacteria bacterium]